MDAYGVYDDTPPDPDTEYTYRVRATLSALVSDVSNESSATTDPVLPDGVSISAEGAVAMGSAATFLVSADYPDGMPDQDKVSSWDVDFGDGNTATFAAGEPVTHTYNERGPFTVTATAHCTAGTMDASTDVIVGPAGLPSSLLFYDDGSATAGSEFHLIAMLRGDGVPENSVQKFAVDWGDGTGDQEHAPDSSNTGNLAHTYPHGGTSFTVIVSAVTDQGLVTTSHDVSVAPGPNDPNPDPPSDTPGNAFGVLGPTPGQPGSGSSEVPVWFGWCGGWQNVDLKDPGTAIIDWDDGPDDPNSSTPHGGDATGINTSPPNTTAVPTHDFQEEGKYLVQVYGQHPNDDGTTSDDGDYGYGWVTAGEDEQNLALKPIADKVVSPGDPVTINATFDGDGIGNKDRAYAYVDWGDGTGLHLIGNVNGGTFTASLPHAPSTPGQYNCTISVYEAENDNEPIKQSFKLDVVGVTIDNLPPDKKQSDGATLVTDHVDPANSFVPVTITVPDSVPDGAQVTLTINDSAASEASIVQGTSADASDPVVIGGDGAPDTITWTKGSGTPPWQNLWMEPLTASQSLADIILTLQVQSSAGNGSDTAKATSYDPKIMFTRDQAGATATDITGKTDDQATPILVGQQVSLNLDGDLNKATDIHWSSEGDTFKDYAIATGASNARIVPMTAAEWAQRSPVYYYQAGFTGQSFNALIECDFIINGESYRRDSAFNIYQPTATFKMLQGRIGMLSGTPDFGLRGDTAVPTEYGMQFTGIVDVSTLPPPLNSPSQLYLTQLITSQNYRIFAGVRIQAKQQDGQTALDVDPSFGGGERYQNQISVAPANGPGADIWSDTPFNDTSGSTFMFRHDKFDDSLMFIPSGAHSEPVALRFIHYEWQGVARLIRTSQGLTWQTMAALSFRRPGAPDLVPSVNAFEQPVWSQTNIGKTWVDI